MFAVKFTVIIIGFHIVVHLHYLLYPCEPVVQPHLVSNLYLGGYYIFYYFSCSVLLIVYFCLYFVLGLSTY